LKFKYELSDSVRDGKYTDKITNYQLLMKQSAALAYPVNEQFSEQKETLKDGGNV
jgi:hypothetical protein